MLSRLHSAQFPTPKGLNSRPACFHPPLSNGGRRQLDVTCMAHPRRVAKVSSQITREISNMLVNDSVLQVALSPERKLGESMDLSAIPSVTSVYVSNDLQVVKVYLSIYSDPKGKQRAMNNLKKLEPYVRKEMGQRVPLRLTPEYRFEYDDVVDEMDLVERVIGEEDVARFKREIQMEQESLQEDDEEEEEEGEEEEAGFFDDDVLEEEEEEKGKPQRQDTREDMMIPPQMNLSTMRDERKRLSLKFRSSDSFRRPGPFDDLFGGGEDAEDDRLLIPMSEMKKPKIKQPKVEQPKAKDGVDKQTARKVKGPVPLSQDEVSKGTWAPKKV